MPLPLVLFPRAARQRRPRRRTDVVLGVATLALAGASSCSVFKQMAGSNTVDLKGAQASEMKIDLRRAQQTICPREPVQVAVHLRAKLAGEPAERWLETWEGRDDANKNGKLDFKEFSFQSKLGKLDSGGWFVPSRDLLASVDGEFTIAAVYKAQPERIKAAASYRPEYGCIASGGGRGLTGRPGGNGIEGNRGNEASDGTPGGDGNGGTNGQPGQDGGPGPELQAFATFVKTPFYDKLIAVRVNGPTPDFLLFPPGRTVSVKASGGNGGHGGHGGDGGFGANGGNGRPDPGDGGRGGDGGNGGNGGNGGPGGALQLIYDERFPELATAINLDTSGGAPGVAGTAGRGGRGGKGGRRGSGTPDAPLASTSDGERGSDGNQGRPGLSGQPGAPGAASAQPGKVSDQFNGIRGVTPL